MFTKELYKITCTRNGETSDIGTYLLKPGPEAPMDCYRNFLNKTDVAVSLKSVPEGFIITDNSEPDTSYHWCLPGWTTISGPAARLRKKRNNNICPFIPFGMRGLFC